MIAQSLRHLASPIGDQHPHPENPRRGDVPGIMQSLERFGQLRPIVVQARTSSIVAGNHTWKAAVELGWTEIAVVRVDLADDEALAYAVADNRHGDLAENDDAALIGILDELAARGELAGTGYQEEDVGALHALLGDLQADAYQPEPAQTGAGALPRREITMLMTSEQADEFGAAVRRLGMTYATTGIEATVREMVKRQAARLDA